MIDVGISATVLTNSLPVMELIFNEGGQDVELIGIGGTLRRLTRSLSGPSRCGRCRATSRIGCS
jgi:DeoR/GlpR family transcriptional regulator of sugar metabolism